jgi:hypothetical protein
LIAVDDGSGVVPCFVRLPSEDADTTEPNVLVELEMKRMFRDAANVGSVVNVIGDVDSFRYTLQLAVNAVRTHSPYGDVHA